jgi:hypothetical protein
MSRRDKIMIIGLVALVLLLFLKSFILDPYQPKNDAEENFMTYVEEVMETRYSGGLYGWFIHVKVVKISEMSTQEKAYKDLEGNTQIADGTYKAKVRKYILGVLPYSEESILEGVK